MYLSLVGKKVVGVVIDDTDKSMGAVYGLMFNDDTIAWIMRDAEGNGPGFLHITTIEKPKKERR